MKKYYSINGKNALGVYDNWFLVTYAQKYIKSFSCKSFTSFDEAEKYCLEKARNMFSLEYVIPDSLPINFILYKKNLKKYMIKYFGDIYK